MGAVLVVGTRTPVQKDRAKIDATAKELVLNAYREASHTKSQDPFAEALASYLARYPNVSRELAGHAVAHILANAGI